MHALVSLFYSLLNEKQECLINPVNTFWDTIDKIIDFARKAFMKDFVFNHLGLSYIRENFIRLHTRGMAKALFTEGKNVANL